MTAFDSIKQVLDIWLKVSTHIRLRDRSCKTLQYGCQMMLGFYGAQMSRETKEMLSISRYQASTARKAFWMFKSINHIQTIAEMIEKSAFSLNNNELGLNLIGLIEQLYYVLYHYTESVVYLARTKMIDPSHEESITGWLNNSWFVSDFFSWLGDTIRLGMHLQHLRLRYSDLVNDYKRIESCRSPQSSPLRQRVIVEKPFDQCIEIRALRNIVGNKELMMKLFDTSMEAVISTMEVIVSAEYYGLFKKYCGAPLGDGWTGFNGCASSALILFAGTVHAYRSVVAENKEKKS